MLVEKLAAREWLSVAECYEIRGVRTIEEIRHARLLQLLRDKRRFPTVQAFADAIERNQSQISQWKTRSKRRKDGEVTGVSNINSEMARHIESKVGLPTGWMDNDPSVEEPWPFSDELFAVVRELSNDDALRLAENQLRAHFDMPPIARGQSGGGAKHEPAHRPRKRA